MRLCCVCLRHQPPPPLRPYTNTSYLLCYCSVPAFYFLAHFRTAVSNNALHSRDNPYWDGWREYTHLYPR